jgi:CheY-like chemotaxis protein/HPt (histidine-containing phosphotransfer) domain-containing protein
MAQYQIDELFDEYTRFNTDFNRTIVGTGLGMHITKRLVDAMNGEIFVESVIDEGSIFTVRLPQKYIGSTVCGPDLAEQLCSSRFKSTMKMNRAQIVHELMPYGSVLVVDDVESNLYVAKGLLLPYGLNIETVTNGFDAIKKVRDGAVYDIIFMDQMMPKMDGTEATKLIRETGYNHPVVAMTANAVTGSAELFLAAGFDGYISKPVDIRELNSLLNRLIRDKRPKDTEMYGTTRLNDKDASDAAWAEINKKNQAALSELGMDTQICDEMVEAVIEDIEYALGVLDELLSRQGILSDADVKLYTTTVHGIKSALANIDEKGLSAAAFELEKLGDDNRVDDFLSETPAFTESLRSLLVSLRS